MNLKNKRKLANFIIDRELQSKFVFWMTFTGIFLIFLLCAIVYYYTSENYDLLIEMSPMQDVVKEQLKVELQAIIFKMIFAGIGFLVLVSLLGVVISHRIAGPVYRMRKLISEIVDDGVDHEKITLRPGDELWPLADDISRLMIYLKKQKKA